MKTDSKKDFRRFLWILAAVFCLAGAGVVVTDPFYQYHEPWFGMPVIMEDAVYQTPGAARNLKYRDAIVGTSMTENFHTDWFDEELGWNTMKLSYSGARSNDLNAIFTQIFSREEPVEHIFMDINDYQLTVPSWTAYVVRPEYLYNSSVADDYKYVFNRDVYVKGWRRIFDGLDGVESNIDSAYTWEEPELFGREIALSTARDIREQLLLEQGENSRGDERKELEEKLAVCQENLDNILPFIRENPDTEFIVYFPPYSMIYWEQRVLEGNLEQILQIYQYAIGQFLECSNVRVYYFQNEKEIITNLDNYRDGGHHRPEYNRYIFDCVKRDEKRITRENLEEQLRDMYEFAAGYDYEALWE